MKSPSNYAPDTRESRLRLGYEWLRAASFATVLASLMIIVTGAVVRVTGSGLGCDTWPRCSAESLTPTAGMGLHSAIEFGNRMLTFVLCVAVGVLIIVAHLQRERIRGVIGWAWAQFAMIVLNAVVGGITVLARLSPYIVAAHFLAAMALLTVAVGTWHRVRTAGEPALEEPDVPRDLQTRISALGTLTLVVTAVTIVLGTLVTGTGPHAGDSSAIKRMSFDWTAVTLIHGAAALASLALGVLLLVIAIRTRAARLKLRATTFVALISVQAIVGIAQSTLGLPEWLIVIHLLCAALVWTGALRIFFDTRVVLSARPEPVAAHV